MPHLIVTADDFGKDPETNRAVGIGKEEGILTSASLMVVTDSWKEAVDIAREKEIDVGLHVSITEGKDFRSSPAKIGIKAQFLPSTISWIKREIDLQCKRFISTGLPLNKIDSHHHIHIHPRIGRLFIDACKRYGIRIIRIPYEPWDISNRHLFRNSFYKLTFSILSRLLFKEAKKEGLIFPDGVFGLYMTGEINEGWLISLLEKIREEQSVYELYLHPRDKKGEPGFEELKAITDSKVRDKIEELGIRLISFKELLMP